MFAIERQDEILAYIKEKKSASVNELAKERGQTLAEMSLSWVLARKAVSSVIIGASRPEQIVQNVTAVNCAPFSEEELSLINKIALE